MGPKEKGGASGASGAFLSSKMTENPSDIIFS